MKTYIGVLSQEHYFWTQNRSVIVQGHLLSVYKVKSNLYRPESYREDKGYAEKLKGSFKNTKKFTNTYFIIKLYFKTLWLRLLKT